MNTAISRRGLLRGAAASGALFAAPEWAQSEAVQPLAARLARYAFDLSITDVDADTLETLRVHLVDTFGCALGALHASPVRAAYRIAADAPGRSTLLGTTRRTSPELAAFANGAAIRFEDLNDAYGSKEIGHPSDLISATLAVSQAERRGAADFVVATLLAYEVECRLFDAAAISPRGWDHPTYTPVAAALAAGKLMGLTVAQLTEAVNIALINHIAMNQTRVQVISSWKGLADADATRSGVFAARLAREGITGPSPIFEGEAGFEKMVAGAPMNIDVGTFGGRGRRFRLHDCPIKPFPAQGHTLTAIAATLDIAVRLQDRRLIAAIEVVTTRPGLTINAADRTRWRPTTRETADHSLPYVVARALLDGRIDAASYAPDKLASPDVIALMDRITVREDPALTAMLPKRVPNRVIVKLADGTVLDRQVEAMPGLGGVPLGRADIEAKFWRAQVGALSKRQGTKLLRRFWTLGAPGGADVEALMAAAAVQGE